MLDVIRKEGEHLGDEEIETSDVIVPPADTSMAEATAEFGGENVALRFMDGLFDVSRDYNRATGDDVDFALGDDTLITGFSVDLGKGASWPTRGR